MSITEAQAIRHRILAYIRPRTPTTQEQSEALETAIEVQKDYEASSAIDGVPGAVSQFSLGDFSATLAEGSRYPAYTRETISPVAWSILRNAGLIVYSLPTARKP